MEVYSNTKEGQLDKESVGQRTWADRRCNAKGKRCVGYSQVQRYDDGSSSGHNDDNNDGKKGVCMWGYNKLYTKQHTVQVMGGIGRQYVAVLLRIFV